MKTLSLLTLLTAVFLSGCATRATQQYRAGEEEKIREAVLLDYLALRDTNRVVFVSFSNSAGNHADPSDAVIARIRAAGIPARKASEATRNNHTIVIDKTSGEPGVIYYAGVL